MSRRIPTGLGTEPGESLILLGDTRDEFDGSIWAQVTADHLGGLPPAVDLAREKLLAEVLTAASRDGLVSAAHDLSEGGLAQAVVEAALAGETGCRIVLPEGADPVRDVVLRVGGPRAGRRAAHRGEPVHARCARRAACRPPGSASSTRAADAVEVQGQFTVSLAELRSTSEGVLPGLFG